MILMRLLLALALVAGLAVGADAAVTIRTAPAFPPPGGAANCFIANGGSGAGDVTLTLFSLTDNGPIVINGGVAVGPNQTTFGSTVNTTGQFDGPSWCECLVPNKADFRCSFTAVYPDGNVTVVPAK